MGVPKRPSRAPALALVLALVLASGGLGMTGPAPATEGGKPLDALFVELQSTEDPAHARRITRRIRHLWREHDDERAYGLLRSAVRAIQARRIPEAIDLLDLVVVAAPDFAEAWSQRAVAYYLLGDYTRSEADLRRTLALEPRHFPALSQLGAIHMIRERHHEALEVLHRALALNPHLTGARRNIETIRERVRRGVSAREAPPNPLMAPG
jgi:tetratricopeptide (TPR) repeat protein